MYTFCLSKISIHNSKQTCTNVFLYILYSEELICNLKTKAVQLQSLNKYYIAKTKKVVASNYFRLKMPKLNSIERLSIHSPFDFENAFKTFSLARNAIFLTTIQLKILVVASFVSKITLIFFI